ncbi:TPA: fimbrial protein [Serratia marcescens]
MSITTKALLLAGGLMGGVMAVQAANGEADMTFHGTLFDPPPCSVNNDRAIEVDFGDVMTTRIDGTAYQMPVAYTLSCTAGVPNTMKLQVQGTGASFDSKVLKTNKTGLGVKLQQGTNKSALAINTWLNFTYPNKPALWAVPVKQSGATLNGGEFTATATLRVDYQ